MSLAEKLTKERRQRLAAERMLELKKSELSAANRQLDKHAKQLTEEIVETRAEVETIKGENKRVKSDLSAANQRTAIAERRLWQSIETIRDGFAFFDRNSKLVMANRAYLETFDGLQDIRPGVDYVTILQLLTEEGIVNTGEQTPEQWRQEMIDRWHAPHPQPVISQLWNGQYLRLVDRRGPDGDMVSLGLNITSNVIYQKQLKQARQIAESANRAKSSFLANMSHEIRTPMNGVVGMADVLTETTLTDEQRLYVDTIRHSGEALLVIINDVLDYSKIDAQKLELYPEAFDLERTIREVLMLLQPAARAKNLSLLMDYDLFLPTNLVGDPGRLRQVLTNLIGNAVKFTTKGHVLVRVTGTTDLAQKTVSLHVAIEDTGIGIPADKVDHIFGEFFQVQNDRNRQFDGTGLGLAITKQLVTLMQGETWLTSQEHVGSCFGFSVALGMVAGSLPNPKNLRNITGQALVVSDVAVTRDLLTSQLIKMGVDATPCTSGNAAIAQLKESTPFIVVDHDFTRLDGLTLANKAQKAVPNVPIILLSSNPTQIDNHPDRPLVKGVLHFPPPRDRFMALIDTITASSQTNNKDERRAVRVLAAEDNKTNQLVFRKMLKAFNIDLTFAENGEKAVAAFSEVKPDLIFMDISMPKMDGKAATKAIRALEKKTGGHIPIIALTAHAMGGDDIGVLAAGLDRYLTKPLRKADILKEIEAVLTVGMKPLCADHVTG